MFKIDSVKVKEVMEKKGIKTQKELAEKLNISAEQLSLMLSSRYTPLKAGFIDLCETLDLFPRELLHAQEEHNLIEAKTNKNFTAIELFAGGGGLALGLEQAGINALLHVEIDKNACETLRTNRPSWNIVEDDIQNICFKQYNNKIDIVTGGFPCQAFSYAGQRLGLEDTRGTLFYEFARCVNETQPKIFMAENVRGLISHDQGRTLKTILSVFQDLGYKIEYKVLNAVDYGVPQKRQRIFIIGTREGIEFKYPMEHKNIKTIRDALKNVPKSEGQAYSENKKKILALVPPGGYWRDLPIDVQKSYMGKSFYSGGGRTGMARRMSWDEPSLTLTCSPSQKQTERCHPEETRPFTVREYARIQTFPDDWQFRGGIGAKYAQIGNAVPVYLAKQIGKQIIKALN